MIITTYAKRRGQAGLSTFSMLLAATLAKQGSRVLYVPLTQDLDDIFNWINRDNKLTVDHSITILDKLVEGNTFNMGEVKKKTHEIMTNFDMLDTRETTLEQGRFNIILSEIITAMETNATTVYSHVIFELVLEPRSLGASELLLKESDKIIHLLSNNETIYSEEVEAFLEPYIDKVISVKSKVINKTSKINIIAALMKAFGKATPQIVYDSEIIASQNNFEFDDYLKDLIAEDDTDKDVKQIQIYNSIKSLIKQMR